MATDPSKIKFVLLADDDDDDTMLFVEATETLSPNIKVSLAGDGQQLLTLLETSTPDIIFLDLNMPKKSGIECLKAIRSNTKYDRLPVIMYSTSQNKKDIDACFNAGANYYVVKPYDFEDIITILQKLFSQLADETSIVPDKSAFVINTRNDK